MLNNTIDIFALFILIYFFAINISYIILFLISFLGILSYRRDLKLYNYILIYQSKLTPPISLIVPAYNESETIIKNINSFLSQFDYPEYEVIMVNDGSKDNTLDLVLEEFDCEIYDIPFKKSIDTKQVKNIYRSKINKRLLVVDKENGGKADALNVGINIAKYPYFGSIDADTILEPDSYLKVIMPIVNDPQTVIASGGIVGVINGCKVVENRIEEVNFPKNILAKFQLIEYLRAFLFGRYAWSTVNALPLISGAFGLFKKEAVLKVGGYSTSITKHSTVGEDIELVIRLHERYLREKERYKIVFVPDPLSWTQVPEDIKTLKNQRARWHRGLMETMFSNYKMIFNYKYKTIGLVSLPYYFFFELMAPVIELTGYTLIPFFYINKQLDARVFYLFLILAVLFGVLVSLLSVFLEISTFRRYKKNTNITSMMIYAILENFGYRQLTLVFRLIGIVQFFKKTKGWGEMKRQKV